MGLDVNAVQFKLAPTYTIYMATRFRASTHYRPELIPEERAIRLTAMLDAVSDCIFGKFGYFLALFAVLGEVLSRGLPDFGLLPTTDPNSFRLTAMFHTVFSVSLTTFWHFLQLFG